MVGQQLYSQNFLVMETMAAVAFYYILIVTVFDFLLKRLENYLDVTQRNHASGGCRDAAAGDRAAPGNGAQR
jgi:polar amino acid transport system permease protein